MTSSNRLAAETSPYLLQHANNPVHWQPWGEQALTLARQENRPILLSIGYSACHWCHVMAHESFEDDAVAAVMNNLFVNIKVDREERPDLDQIYQTAHHMLTRRNGGWPLTMFLAPDGTPFFGGTYFPKEPRYGLPGFADVCQRVATAYRERGEVGAFAAKGIDRLFRPIAVFALHNARSGKIHQPGVAAMQQAEKMHRIGQIARCRAPFDQFARRDIGVRNRPLIGDQRINRAQ